MIYHAPTGRLVIDIDKAKYLAESLRYALAAIRRAAGQPLARYQREPGTALTQADHAQKHIIDGAYAVGIDLGGRWGNELDLSDLEG